MKPTITAPPRRLYPSGISSSRPTTTLFGSITSLIRERSADSQRIFRSASCATRIPRLKRESPAIARRLSLQANREGTASPYTSSPPMVPARLESAILLSRARLMREPLRRHTLTGANSRRCRKQRLPADTVTTPLSRIRTKTGSPSRRNTHRIPFGTVDARRHFGSAGSAISTEWPWARSHRLRVRQGKGSLGKPHARLHRPRSSHPSTIRRRRLPNPRLRRVPAVSSAALPRLGRRWAPSPSKARSRSGLWTPERTARRMA